MQDTFPIFIFQSGAAPLLHCYTALQSWSGEASWPSRFILILLESFWSHSCKSGQGENKCYLRELWLPGRQRSSKYIFSISRHCSLQNWHLNFPLVYHIESWNFYSEAKMLLHLTWLGLNVSICQPLLPPNRQLYSLFGKIIKWR